MPSYVGSKAGIGLGTQLSIDTGTSGSPTWTLVAEIKTIAQSGRQVAKEDTTNMQSSASEFIPTLLTSGQWKVTGSRIGSDAGQLAMETAFAALALKGFQIVLPKENGQTTSGDTFAFTALIEDLNYDIEFNKSVTFTATLTVSGAITVTAGS
jgi:predicted secreted protein